MRPHVFEAFRIAVICSPLLISGCGLAYIKNLPSLDRKIETTCRIVVGKTLAQEVVHLLGRPHRKIPSKDLERFIRLEGPAAMSTSGVTGITHAFSYEFTQVTAPAVIFGLRSGEEFDVLRPAPKMSVSIGVFLDENNVIKGYFVRGEDLNWPLEIRNGEVIFGGAEDRWEKRYRVPRGQVAGKGIGRKIKNLGQ